MRSGSAATERDLAERGGGRWSDASVRFASALVLGPLSLAAIWVGGAAWAVLLSALALAAVAEWGGICGWQRSAAPTIGAGILYVGIAWASLLLLRTGGHGRADLLFVMGVVWAADIGAYAAGRLIGGPRLWPALSPAKTWAGAVGGLAAGVAIGGALAGTEESDATLRALAAAAALTIAAQAGDLAESALKRHYGKKDSGWLIPGHGGVLDRVDGLLAAAPVAYLFAVAAGAGEYLWQW